MIGCTYSYGLECYNISTSNLCKALHKCYNENESTKRVQIERYQHHYSFFL